jgi:four helix bundle protein
MAVRRYQDLEAWQLADELKREVYALVASSPAKNDRRFCQQIFDAAASGPSNLSEGFGRYAHAEFARFSRVAKASILETHNHVGDGYDRGYWSADTRDRVQQIADRAAGATTRLIAYLDVTEAPGIPRRRRRRR